MPGTNHDDNAVCQINVIHQEILEDVRDKLESDRTLKDMAELFKALHDPARLKIINALLLAEMCVCDIAALMEMSQPAVSHHLKVLRQGHLVKYRREGKVTYYSLDDEHVELVFKQGLAHVK